MFVYLQKCLIQNPCVKSMGFWLPEEEEEEEEEEEKEEEKKKSEQKKSLFRCSGKAN